MTLEIKLQELSDLKQQIKISQEALSTSHKSKFKNIDPKDLMKIIKAIKSNDKEIMDLYRDLVSVENEILDLIDPQPEK